MIRAAVEIFIELVAVAMFAATVLLVSAIWIALDNGALVLP